MADVSKPKLQLRSSLSMNGDKTPSPATKLLINHGKPNFTIQRSPKAQNGNVNPMSPSPSPTPPSTAVAIETEVKASNEFVVKSTTFNGVLKPSNISAATKQILQQNGTTTTNGNANANVNGNDNEAAKVVLRRAKVVQSELTENGDDNVPEFIRRQRRIQERLANQNILDFENRRSGYFTQVMISPSSPNRQSFVETMASPAVKPGLEIPPPPSPQHDNIEEEIQQEPNQQSEVENNNQVPVHEVKRSEEPVTLNGQVEEEEVAKAIEEVNKAVEGEDEEDKTELEEHIKHTISTTSNTEQCEDTSPQIEEKHHEQIPVDAEVTSAMVEAATHVEETQVVAVVVTSAVEVTEEQQQQQNGPVEALVTSDALTEDNIEEPKTNGVVEVEPQHNGEALDNKITISHTNGLSGPSLPCPDPKGEKSVNFEPKTVVSFSQELGNNVNKYPDTVQLVKEVDTPEVDNELRELTKLKFEIKADEKDIEVKPVLITELA